MSASFSFSLATVTLPDATVHVKHRIIVRQGTARITDRRGVVVAEKAGVENVRVTGTRTRLVEFADGDEWQVLRDKGCGCGSGG